MRIGIDVGGTNTDAVLMDGTDVRATIKTPATANVTEGITIALRALVDSSRVDVGTLDGVMIGTTHFTNAMIECRRLEPNACICLGFPATGFLPPLVDWPDDMAEVLGRHTYLPTAGTSSMAVRAPPLTPTSFAGSPSRSALLTKGSTRLPSRRSSRPSTRSSRLGRPRWSERFCLTLPSTVGRIGLLEHEKAAIMNSCLRTLAVKTISGFKQVLCGDGPIAARRSDVYSEYYHSSIMFAEPELVSELHHGAHRLA